MQTKNDNLILWMAKRDYLTNLLPLNHHLLREFLTPVYFRDSMRIIKHNDFVGLVINLADGEKSVKPQSTYRDLQTDEKNYIYTGVRVGIVVKKKDVIRLSFLGLGGFFTYPNIGKEKVTFKSKITDWLNFSKAVL